MRRTAPSRSGHTVLRRRSGSAGCRPQSRSTRAARSAYTDASSTSGPRVRAGRFRSGVDDDIASVVQSDAEPDTFVGAERPEAPSQ